VIDVISMRDGHWQRPAWRVYNLWQPAITDLDHYEVSTVSSTDDPTSDTSRDQAQALHLLTQVPWTLGALLCVLVVTVSSGTLWRPPTATQLDRYGTSAERLLHGDLWSLATSNAFVDRPPALLSTLILIAVMVGLYEYSHGTGWAAAVWFLGTAAGTLVAVPLWQLGVGMLGVRSGDHGATLDVGSSAACWCALGAWVGWPPAWRRWQRYTGWGAVLSLLLLLVAHQSYAEVEHVAAFACGACGLGLLHQRWRGRQRGSTVTWLTIGRVLVALTGLLAAVVGLMRPGGWGAAALLGGGCGLLVLALTGRDEWWPALICGAVTLTALALRRLPNASVAGFALLSVAVLGYGVWQQFPPRRARAVRRDGRKPDVLR
jgi:hypothetical protein